MAKAQNSPPEERAEIFWTALLVNGGMGIFGAGILWMVGHYLVTSILEMPDDFKAETIAALPWMAITFPLALASSVLNGALEGCGRFLIVNILQVITNTIFQIIPLSVAYLFNPSLAWVIPAAVLSRAAMNIFFFAACRRYVPLAGSPRFSIDKARLLFAYGGWVAVTGAAGPLLDSIERFIIGALLGVSSVTHFTIPTQLVSKLKVLPGSLSRALFPAFSSASNSESVVLAANSITWLSSVMALVVSIAVLALRPFLEFWIGLEIAAIAAPIGELLLIGVWLNSVAHVPYSYLQATGRPDLVAKLHAAEFLPYVFLIWAAINEFGLIGAAVAWVFRCLVEAGVLFSVTGLVKKTAFSMAGGATVVVAMVITAMTFPQIALHYRIALACVCFLCGLFILARLSFRKQALSFLPSNK